MATSSILAMTPPSSREHAARVEIVPYSGEHRLRHIKALIDKDLSEPYSIFTYRYFLLQWPHLCFLAVLPGEQHDCVGTIICKLVRDVFAKIVLAFRQDVFSNHVPESARYCSN